MRHFVFLCIALTTFFSAFANADYRSDKEREEFQFHHDALTVDAVSLNSATASEKFWTQRLSYFFIVEHFGIQKYSSFTNAIKRNPPAGIIFWNPKNKSALETKNVVFNYSKYNEQYGLTKLPLLFSIDYEGGGLAYSKTGKKIPGIQRVKTGLSKLAHGSWLGLAAERNLSSPYDICQLHGQIMGKELFLMGINYPLATVADLRRGLFSVRGISRDPEIVGNCLSEILDGMVKGGNERVVFVTKHFPGLGRTRGDTHDVDSKYFLNRSDFDNDLRPFQKVIDESEALGKENLLNLMSGHANYKPVDPKNKTTESKIILNDILRTQMNYQGVTVSDAMWMGEYGKIETDAYRGIKSQKDLYNAINLIAFIRGIDLLMTMNRQFSKLVNYFQRAYLNQLSRDEITALEKRSGEKWSSLHQQFVAKIPTSFNRIQKMLNKVGYAHKQSPTNKEPLQYTPHLRSEYYKLLKRLNPNLWSSL